MFLKENNNKPSTRVKEINNNNMWKEEYKKRFGCENYPHPEIRDFIQVVLDNQKQFLLAKIEGKIGFLRQWINERPSDRMVTNKDIKEWLNL